MLALGVGMVLVDPAVTDGDNLQVLPVQVRVVGVQNPLARHILALGHPEVILVQVVKVIRLDELDRLPLDDFHE